MMTAKFYHHGLAEALVVTQTRLEEMTLRELAERAYAMGADLLVGGDGKGPGLTLRADSPAVPADIRNAP